MAGKVRENYRRNPSGAETCQLGVRIEKETADELDKICLRECVSRSALVRRMIRQYITENKNQEENL